MCRDNKRTIVAKVRPAIAMVEDVSLSVPGERKVGDSIVGTAFVADVRGYLLTAKHVVQGLRAEDINVRTTYSGDGSGEYSMGIVPIKAIYWHPSDDIAVLATNKAFPDARVIGPLRSNDVEVGEDIVITGYAVGTDLVFCDDVLGAGSAKSFSPVSFGGMVCARIPDDGRPLELIAYDCTTFGGNSGAPVVAVKTADIVALHLRGYENHVGYGVPIGRCQSFLNAVVQVHEDTKQRLRGAKVARRLAR